MRFSATVSVQLRGGIADPEGATIERALPALGIDAVHAVRAGRSFLFDVEAASLEEATVIAQDLASRLLANPVMEDHDVKVEAK